MKMNELGPPLFQETTYFRLPLSWIVNSELLTVDTIRTYPGGFRIHLRDIFANGTGESY